MTSPKTTFDVERIKFAKNNCCDSKWSQTVSWFCDNENMVVRSHTMIISIEISQRRGGVGEKVGKKVGEVLGESEGDKDDGASVGEEDGGELHWSHLETHNIPSWMVSPLFLVSSK